MRQTNFCTLGKTVGKQGQNGYGKQLGKAIDEVCRLGVSGQLRLCCGSVNSHVSDVKHTPTPQRLSNQEFVRVRTESSKNRRKEYGILRQRFVNPV
jgi:hypothetical protein